MKVRRNELCPCGSGKKYKKCCLKKDEESRRQARTEEAASAAAAAAEAEAPEPDADASWDTKLWAEFDAGDYEQKIEIFSRSLGEDELDDYAAFEMLNQIESEAFAKGERERFDGLIDTLRERRPEVYEAGVGNFADWKLTNALVAGRTQELSEYTTPLANEVDRYIDTLENMLDRLAYHGHMAPVLEAMRIAWPQVKESREIMGWAIAEFGQRLANLETLDYAASAPEPRGDAPELLARFERYGADGVDQQRLAEFVDFVLGRAGVDWTQANLEIPRDQDEDEDEEEGQLTEAVRNLFNLTVEFLGWAQREEGLSAAGGELARSQVFRYLIDRQSGDLDDKARRGPRRKSKGRKRKPPAAEAPKNPLCPDRATLDHFLSQSISVLNFAPYRVAATYEVMPLWVRFLESRGLATAEERTRAIEGLKTVGRDLKEVFAKMLADPALHDRTAKALERIEG